MKTYSCVCGLVIAVAVTAVIWATRGPSPPGIELQPAMTPENSVIGSIKHWRIDGHIGAAAWHVDGDSLFLEIESKRSREYSILRFNVQDGSAKVLDSSGSAFYSVASSADGQSIATARWWSGTETADAWMLDADSGEHLHTLVGPSREGLAIPFSSDALHVAVSNDGRFAAVVGKLVDNGLLVGAHIGGWVTVWDLTNGTVVWSDRSTHTDIVYCAEFSPDGTMLATAGIDKLIRLWDPVSGTLLKTLHGAAWDGVSSLSFSSDGQLLATGGHGREDGHHVRVFDVQRSILKHQLSGGFARGGTIRVEYDNDGTLYATGRSGDTPKTLRVVRFSSESVVPQVVMEEPGASTSITCSPDGASIAVTSYEGDVYVLEID